MTSNNVSTADLLSWVATPGTVILDAQQIVGEAHGAWLYHSPRQVLQARSMEDVRPVLREAQELARGGAVLAGWIAYEAAGAFDLAVANPAPDLPLVWLGLFDRRPMRVPSSAWPVLPDDANIRHRLSEATANGVYHVTPEDYMYSIERIRELIAAGDTYQVNYTCRYNFSLPDDANPFAFYCCLRQTHPVPYGAFINTGTLRVLSCSPELFLHRAGDRITTRPMKGTIARGRSAKEDAARRNNLFASVKNRAENVMIVDLMRNDLGRVCKIGSIAVPRLFAIERYASLYQMTSTVTGRVRDGLGLCDVLEAVFPCGSVTGAPKRRTMEIIRDLEARPRGVYCGAVGRLGPGDDMALNVAIRTVVCRPNGACELGVGSGITWSSDPMGEWRETRLKSRFLQMEPSAFRLIETLRLAGGQYDYLKEHLLRLGRSARYWQFRYPSSQIQEMLEAEAAGDPSERIVRVALEKSGAIHITTRPLMRTLMPIRVWIRPERIDPEDRMLYHKTDRRALYDRALEEIHAEGFYEALFRNTAGNLTEGAFTNLFAEFEEGWVTPPMDSGLLPGIWRAAFMRKTKAVERRITPENLARARRIVIGNSVRGEIAVHAVMSDQGSVLWIAPIADE